VRTWVFDLDNTLYPAGSDIWPKIDARMTAFMMALLGIDGLSARALQKFYYQRYGTTLRGLIHDYGIDPRAFLGFVHDIDRSNLREDADLALAIESLHGRKLILTNGTRDHAWHTMRQLGVAHVFEAIFDIVDADLIPKPHEDAYARFFDAHDIDPRSAAMFEDIAHNLAVPHARGMITTLVVPHHDAGDHREAWEQERHDAHIDFITDDLTGFLRKIAAHHDQ
jgi:putative hydrolase of the HAD superfamily